MIGVSAVCPGASTVFAGTAVEVAAGGALVETLEDTEKLGIKVIHAVGVGLERVVRLKIVSNCYT